MLSALILAAVVLMPTNRTAGAALQVAGRIEPKAAVGAAAAAPVEATVELLPAVQDFAAAKRRLAGDPADRPLAVTHASDDGTFRLLAPSAGCYRVTVRAKGYLPVEFLLTPLVAERELPPVRLTAATPIAMRALGPQGEPLAGVAVALGTSRDWATESESWHPAESAGRTGVDGRVTLPGAVGEVHLLTVLDPRFYGVTQVVGRGAAASGGKPAEATLRLQPRPDRALRLEALTPDGSAVGGALLRLPDGTPIAAAGSDGRLPITAADPLALLRRGASTLESPAGDVLGEISWESARGGTLRATLHPWRAAAGRLADSDDGHALTGGVVWAERNDPQGSAVVLAATATGQDGSFRLRLPAVGDVQLRAAAPGHVPGSPPLSVGPEPLRILLERAQELDGLIVDGEGHAIAGAKVTAREADGAPTARPAATTSEDGRFRLPALAPGQQYQLTAAADGFAPGSTLAALPRRAAGAPAAPLRIVLSRGRAISGVVVDGAGRPLPDVTVTLVPFELRGLWRSVARSAGCRETQSDSRGAFAIANLKRGNYALAAHGPGHATTLHSPLDLSTATGPPLDVGRLVMEPGVVIEGVVTDRRGAAVAGASVTLSSSSAGQTMLTAPSAEDIRLDVETDGEGRFRIAELHPGTNLYIATTDHPPARVQVQTPTAQPLRIELQGGCRLTGRVLDGNRQPIFGAVVSADAKSEEPMPSLPGMFQALRSPGAASDARGEFALKGLTPGRVDLAVAAEGYLQARVKDLDLAVQGETGPVEVVLVRGAGITGRVLDSAGHPLAGAAVTAMRDIGIADLLRRGLAGDAPSKAALSAPDGRYRLTGLEAGKYRVGVDRKGMGRDTRFIAVEVGEKDLDLDLVAGDELVRQSVAGRVVEDGGAPIEGARVELTAEGAGSIQDQPLWSAFENSSQGYAAESAEDGSFLVPDVAPGNFRLAATAPGHARGTFSGLVSVADGPVDRLELVLAPTRGVVRGKIRGLEPQELSHARVFAESTDGSSQGGYRRVTGTLDESGAYSIGGLALGRWAVTAASFGGRTARGTADLAVGTPEAELDLDLTGGVTITGKVSSHNRPVAGAMVGVGKPDQTGAGAQTQTAGDGGFSLSGLPPGSYLAMAFDMRTFVSNAVAVELGDSDQDIRIDLTTGALQGKVVSAATGQPIAGATVAWERINLQVLPCMFPASSGADGVFDLGQVAAGRYQVKATAPGFDAGKATTEVAPDGTATVEVQLAPSSSPH